MALPHFTALTSVESVHDTTIVYVSNGGHRRAARPRHASDDLRSSSLSTWETGGAGELPDAESTCCTGPHDVVVGRADRFVGIFEPTHASTDAPHRQHIAAGIGGAFADGRTVD